MGIYEDIEQLAEDVIDMSKHLDDRKEDQEQAQRVLDWLQSPSCPITEGEQ